MLEVVPTKTERLNKRVIDSYMYRDTLYMLCSDSQGDNYMLYSYDGVSLRGLIMNIPKVNDYSRPQFRHNSDGTPEIIYVNTDSHDNLQIRNMLTNEVMFKTYVDWHYHKLKYYDDTVVFVPKTYDEELYVYTPNNRIVHTNFKYHACNLTPTDGKIYFLELLLKEKKVTIRSLDIKTGELKHVHKYDMLDEVFYEGLSATLVMVDDVLYCGSYSVKKPVCYDIKTGRHYHGIEPLNNNNVFSSKTSNKLYTFYSCDICEYNVIRDTLFRSYDMVSYPDMTIVIRDDQ